nr:leucine-rich repeat domain-containing protein [Candidatus Sigynarchaeota archaeon]
VNLSSNVITNIPRLHLPKLVFLDLGRNKITEFKNLTTMSSLEEIYLYDNKINEIPDLSRIVTLSVLDLANNDIEKVDGLSNNMHLECLDVRNNSVTEVNPEIFKLSHLDYLLLSGNPDIKLEMYARIDKRGILTNPEYIWSEDLDWWIEKLHAFAKILEEEEKSSSVDWVGFYDAIYLSHENPFILKNVAFVFHSIEYVAAYYGENLEKYALFFKKIAEMAKVIPELRSDVVERLATKEGFACVKMVIKIMKSIMELPNN